MKKDFEMIHSDKYADAVRMAKKFTANPGARMVLTMVQHMKDGSIRATDSHRLLVVRDVHRFKEEYLVNPSTLEFATGKYPETEKLIPKKRKNVFKLNADQIKLWLQMHKSMNQVAKAAKTRNDITVKMTPDNFIFEVNHTEITFNLPVEEYHHNKKVEKITYQAGYMRDVLESHSKLGSEELYIHMDSQMKPMVLDNQDDVLGIVLPVRTY